MNAHIRQDECNSLRKKCGSSAKNCTNQYIKVKNWLEEIYVVNLLYSIHHKQSSFDIIFICCCDIPYPKMFKIIWFLFFTSSLRLRVLSYPQHVCSTYLQKSGATLSRSRIPSKRACTTKTFHECHQFMAYKQMRNN